jgi:integrase
VAEAGTTARIRRRQPAKFDAFIQGRLPLQRDGSTPPPPPFPRGDLRTATIGQITEAAAATWPQWRSDSRRSALHALLAALERREGRSWQQRWVNGGFDQAGHPVSRISAAGPDEPVTPALAVLFALRVIAPSVSAVRSNRLLGYPCLFRAAQADPALDALFTVAGQIIPQEAIRREALADITVALTSEAVALRDLTPGRFLNYVLDSRTHVITAARHQRKRYRGHHAWDLLHRAGHFPPGTPDTLKEAIREPRLTPGQLVARHDIADPGMRQLLADYLTVRGAEMDYSSLRTLAAHLAGLFWKQVETLAPGQRDLHLPTGLYEQWRETLRWRQDGKPRKEQDPVLLAVRSFYFDLSAWALQEPARWAVWVAPCPVPQRELRGIARRRRKVTEEIADRTRQRQPLLPRLTDQARQDHARYTELLETGRAASPGQPFAAGGRTWVRVFSPADARREREHGRAHVRLRDTDTGEVAHIDREEERAFWNWAVIETLRLSGCRIEELLEISQLSIRQYRRPGGEVVALLVIAPSKTDRERVIPMSAELFTVIAAIIRRHTRDGRTIPVVARYDPHERETLSPLPYLFQRPGHAGPAVITAGTVVRSLQRVCEQIAEADPAFTGLVFTPHDFRRLFATELVNSGLPIHIGATLLGHLSLETTRGYVAVFDDEVVRHYQAFLHRRRAQRPAEEYKQVTDDEWQEFEEHFDRRKVELGDCARPYGTGCQHEHACLRCPVLQIAPGMLPRLQEIETDLVARRSRAEGERWLGEIEGIDLTLEFLRDKRNQAERAATFVGMPVIRRQQS